MIHARTQVPAYMVVQTVAATAASLMLRLMFGGRHEAAPVTVPAGSNNMQSLVLEFIITFYLMFVIMAVATDDRAVTIKSIVVSNG
jgi:aquaporin NIP